jgi:peptide/nickel transport system substrate-binding protein
MARRVLESPDGQDGGTMRRTAHRFLMTVALCAAAGTASAQGHLRIGLGDDPDVLDPSLSRTYTGRIVFASICDKLFDIDEKLAIVPQLALGHETSADGKTGHHQASPRREIP